MQSEPSTGWPQKTAKTELSPDAQTVHVDFQVSDYRAQ
jgi:hypothetical protein